MGTITNLFFALMILTLYSYAIFPLLLVVLGRLFEKPIAQKEWRPSVTLIISAFNEEAVIARKLENSLQLDYPNDLLEIIVVSDKSEDGTDEIVRGYRERGVVLLSQPERRGKTAGLNEAVKAARGEILVFSDADSMYEPDAIRKMVSYLGDQSVGLVTGSTNYTSGDQGQMVKTSSLYTELERFIKRYETRFGSCVGADGAIFAMKKILYRPLRSDDINDFVIPLDVVKQGYRVVFHDGLFCAEEASPSSEKEFRRQARITNRTLRALFRNASLMNPVRYPAFGFQLVSHKLVRLSVPIFLVLLIPLNILLVEEGSIYGIILFGQGIFYSAAIVGYWRDATGGKDIIRLVYHFVVINISVLTGWYKYLIGDRQATWSTK